MNFPVTQFDGFELGSFDETDAQQADTYSSNQTPTWYGSIDEIKNDRTDFVTKREISFGTLKQAVIARMNSLLTGDHFANRPATINTQNEMIMPVRSWERSGLLENSVGDVPMEIADKLLLLSAVNELSIVSRINQFAYSSPPEMKLQAAVELATWLIRQPVGSNRANALVRSGAASMLEPYKHRGL